MNRNDIYHRHGGGAALRPVHRSSRLIKHYYSLLWNTSSRTVLNWRTTCRRKHWYVQLARWWQYSLSLLLFSRHVPELRANTDCVSWYESLRQIETIPDWNLIQIYSRAWYRLYRYYTLRSEPEIQPWAVTNSSLIIWMGSQKPCL